MNPTLLLAASGGNTLDQIFDPALFPSFIWTLIIFGVSVPLLWKIVFKPIAASMEERELKVRESAAAADRARAETEAMRTSIQQELENARQEASRQLSDAKRRAADREQEMMAAAKEESARERERARGEIEHAVRGAREQLRRDAVILAVEVAEKVIGREFSDADQKRLISDFEKSAAKN